jgi:K+-sensing histidine kinase KdpD
MDTWWAWMAYIAVAAMALWQLTGLRQRMLQEKAAVGRLELEKAQEQRVNQMNMSFFANISMSSRTPLTMISGPVSMLCDDRSLSEQKPPLTPYHPTQRGADAEIG